MFLGQHLRFVQIFLLGRMILGFFSIFLLAICVFCQNNLPFIIIYTKPQLVLFIEDHSAMDHIKALFIISIFQEASPFQ